MKMYQCDSLPTIILILGVPSLLCLGLMKVFESWCFFLLFFLRLYNYADHMGLELTEILVLLLPVGWV